MSRSVSAPKKRRRRNRIPQEPVAIHIESLSHEGRGIGHIDDKTVFVDGALPDEQVMFRYRKRNSRYDEGRVTEVLTASAARVEPGCPHASICGGCSLQHMSPAMQISSKQQTLLDQMAHVGKVPVETVIEPLTGPVFAYRNKARVGVRYVAKKEALLVGFREAGSGLLAELTVCKVLHPAVGERFMALRELIGGLQAMQSIAQIEVAAGDEQVALVFRNLQPLSDSDRQRLSAFAQSTGLQVWLQPAGLDSITPLWPESPEPLSYRLPDHDVELQFLPTDFVQVNQAINRQMVNRVIDLLALDPADRVLDLFCGLGNFSLAIARHVQQVVAVEGEAGLVQRGRDNARRNGIQNCDFHCADLSGEQAGAEFLHDGFGKLLLDPPRSGALDIVSRLGTSGIERIVYVSCNPATLARDAGELVHRQGYRLISAGIMDMFPHTGHVESIAVFEKA